jgi:hypothetical protein
MPATPLPSTSQVRFLLTFGVSFAVIFLLWESSVLYPLKLFVVFLHELSHAMAVVLTGGRLHPPYITINSLQGGACTYVRPDSAVARFLIFSAGYLGSVLWGLLLCTLAVDGKARARESVAVVGTMMLCITVFYIRNVFGVAFGVCFSAGLVAYARFVPIQGCSWLLTCLGLTSCLYAILDVKSDVLDRPHVHSDAYFLWRLTGVPTMVWGILWIAISLTSCAWALKHTFIRVGAVHRHHSSSKRDTAHKPPANFTRLYDVSSTAQHGTTQYHTTQYTGYTHFQSVV